MISELFNNTKVYGRYVRTCKYDGPKSWNKVKEFILCSEQKEALKEINKILGNKWDIEIKLTADSEATADLEVMYDYLHNTLEIKGDYNDLENKQINDTWLKYHYALQPINIARKNQLTIDKLLQIGFNLGRLSLEIKDNEFYGKFIEFYNLNNIDDIETYIKLSDEQKKQIESDSKINEFILKLNNFILDMINKIGNCEINENEKKPSNSEIFYSDDLEQLTISNNDYRNVKYTGTNQQIVLMSINPGDDIKMEVHENHDQFIRIEQGEGLGIVNNKEYKLNDNSSIIVPAGSSHKIINTGNVPLKLYTIYSPPEHPDKLVQETNPDKKNNDENYKQKYQSYKNKYIQLKKFMDKYYK